MNDMGKNLLLWLVIAAVLLTVFQNFNVQRGPVEIEYSSFLDLVNRNQVTTVEVDGLTIRGEGIDGRQFETIQPQIVDKALIDDFHHNVTFKGERPEQLKHLDTTLGGELPHPRYHCGVHVLHAPNARRWRRSRWSAGIWEEQGEASR